MTGQEEYPRFISNRPCGNDKYEGKSQDYLIFLMGETLHKPDREKWRKDIMNLLGIDDTYYKSKYKEPVSDFPSDSNQIFAKEMQSIFR